MKRLSSVFGAILASILMSGCSSALYTSISAGDGMYGVHDRTYIADKQQRKAEQERAEAEARRAQLEALLAGADNVDVASLADYYNAPDSYSSVLADTYESAYARRLMGFSSPTYRMPSSYYDFRYGSAFNYVSAYDPAFYNVMVSGDQVWVEPKYISSMFGTWGATNVTALVAGSWYWGWDYPYYYSIWWGYPRYSWFDWNWGLCYYPYYSWWWGGYYPWRPGWGHGPVYGHDYHWRPQPRRQSIVGAPSYTSPSSGKSYGSGRGSVNGSGIFRGSTSGSRTNSSGRFNSGSSIRSNSSGTRSESGGTSTYNRNRGGSSSFFNYDDNSSRNSNRSSFNNNRSSYDNNSFSSPSRSSGFSGGSFSGGSSGGGHRSGNSLGR